MEVPGLKSIITEGKNPLEEIKADKRWRGKLKNMSGEKWIVAQSPVGQHQVCQYTCNESFTKRGKREEGNIPED